ncbi:MAG: ABC transporter ATP-binding protein [Planctomycetota bacterium]|nr:ABC transporter ATP-binding protein [Planctomycetota bacterium]
MAAVEEAGPALRARGLVKRYGDLVAVAGIDLAVPRGTCLGLLGPNGAGKTTTVECLEGLRDPDEGEVEILGRRWDGDGREIRERIGVQLQETRLQEKLTVHETLRLFRSFYREGRDLGEVVEAVGLVEKRDARIDKLSGGQKQRLALGCALVSRPELLFLDEPTTGLDPQARRRVWEVIEDFKEQGGTVLLTTHYMEEAERLADEVVIIDRGKIIAAGTPAAIIASLGAESIVEIHPQEADRGGGGFPDDMTLRELPGVKEVRHEAGAIALSVTDTQSCIGALLALLARTGVKLEDLRTHRPTLEDVFLSLTGKQLRDE